MFQVQQPHILLICGVEKVSHNCLTWFQEFLYIVHASPEYLDNPRATDLCTWGHTHIVEAPLFHASVCVCKLAKICGSHLYHYFAVH